MPNGIVTHEDVLPWTVHAGVMQKMPAGSGMRRPVFGSTPEAIPQLEIPQTPRMSRDPTNRKRYLVETSSAHSVGQHDHASKPR